MQPTVGQRVHPAGPVYPIAHGEQLPSGALSYPDRHRQPVTEFAACVDRLCSGHATHLSWKEYWFIEHPIHAPLFASFSVPKIGQMC